MRASSFPEASIALVQNLQGFRHVMFQKAQQGQLHKTAIPSQKTSPFMQGHWSRSHLFGTKGAFAYPILLFEPGIDIVMCSGVHAAEEGEGCSAKVPPLPH